MSWRAFIETAPAADHAVQVYDVVDELAASVGRYLDAGFRAGEPAVVIATADHWSRFASDLEAKGWEPAALEREGLLTRRDAGTALASFMDGDVPSAERFERAIGGVFDEVAARFPGLTIRAFGEMVDLLWRRGQEHAAIALEELWSDLARTRRFALLCGYHLDIFDIGVQTQALPRVFDLHSHAQPAGDSSRLAAAVDQALAEVVGPLEAARIYVDVAETVAATSLPRAQAVLAWLSANEPPVAERVLGRVRKHYVRMREAPSGRLAPV